MATELLADNVDEASNLCFTVSCNDRVIYVQWAEVIADQTRVVGEVPTVVAGPYCVAGVVTNLTYLISDWWWSWEQWWREVLWVAVVEWRCVVYWCTGIAIVIWVLIWSSTTPPIKPASSESTTPPESSPKIILVIVALLLVVWHCISFCGLSSGWVVPLSWERYWVHMRSCSF